MDLFFYFFRANLSFRARKPAGILGFCEGDTFARSVACVTLAPPGAAPIR